MSALPPSDTPTANSGATGARARDRREHPPDLGVIAGVVSPRAAIRLAAAATEMGHDTAPADCGEVPHQCQCIVRRRTAFQAVKEDHQRRLFRRPRHVEPVEVDEILVGRVESLAAVAYPRPRDQDRVDGLRVSAGQPGGGAVAAVSSDSWRARQTRQRDPMGARRLRDRLGNARCERLRCRASPLRSAGPERRAFGERPLRHAQALEFRRDAARKPAAHDACAVGGACRGIVRRRKLVEQLGRNFEIVEAAENRLQLGQGGDVRLALLAREQRREELGGVAQLLCRDACPMPVSGADAMDMPRPPGESVVTLSAAAARSSRAPASGPMPPRRPGRAR